MLYNEYSKLNNALWHSSAGKTWIIFVFEIKKYIISFETVNHCNRLIRTKREQHGFLFTSLYKRSERSMCSCFRFLQFYSRSCQHSTSIHMLTHSVAMSSNIGRQFHATTKLISHVNCISSRLCLWSPHSVSSKK